MIITEPFIATALGIAAMAAMPDYPFAAIPHPVGSLSPADVQRRADAVATRVEALLLGSAR